MKQKKDINVFVGKQIKIAREEAKLTQEQLAEKIDVSPQYISDLERGVVGISLATLKRLCIVTGVSADSILFGIKSQNDVAAFSEKCAALSNEHFEILQEIANKYIEAINLKK